MSQWKFVKFSKTEFGRIYRESTLEYFKILQIYGLIFGLYSIYFCTKFLTTLHGASYILPPVVLTTNFPPTKVCLFFLPKNGRWTLYAKVYTHESCTYMVLFAWHETMTANSMMHRAVDICEKVHLVIYRPGQPILDSHCTMRV